MLSAGYSQSEIASTICKSKSVVCREIQRNSDRRNGVYKHDLAQRKHTERQKTKHKKRYFTPDIERFVAYHLGQKYSPEQIVGVAKNQGIKCVSAERIYQYIWHDKKQGGQLFQHLRTKGKRYRSRGASKDKRGMIIGRVDITNRPGIIEERVRLGDLEIDTIIGKGHQGAIVTINDRVTGMLKMKKLDGKDAQKLAQATIELLQEWKPFIKTITSDNGKEFAAHSTISEALNVEFYFAKPYHSWERGSNENLNGLIRQYIPKKTNFETITEEYVKYVENELNKRPRKRHNFASPITIFNQLKNQEKVAFMG
jgi:IS30 family transposase